jgi:hypothetical protein
VDLISWLSSKGATISPKLQILPSSRGGGYGAFVSEPVEVDEILFTIPRTACITLEDATNDNVCGEAYKRVIERAGPGGNTVVMAGFMALERLKCLEDSKKETTDDSSTSFGPYLETLPWGRGMNGQEHILYWDDIDSLIGSMCYSEAESLREEVDLAITVLNGIVGKSIREYRGEDVGFKWPWQVYMDTKANDEPQGPVEGLPEAVKGAFVSLLTRAFQDDDDRDRDEEKMVPLLDMLQHSDIPNVSHVMRKDDGTVEVRARQALKPGEELLNQYRSELEETMPYHRFFTRFGFVPGIQEAVENLLQDKSSIFFAQKREV